MKCHWKKPCNVAHSSGMTCHWIRQVAALCNVTCGSRMARHWIRQVAASCNVARGSGMTCHWIRQLAAPCNVARSSGMTCHWIRQVAAPCNVTRGSGMIWHNSLCGSTLQCGTWLWDHDIKFTRWQHPAMCNEALGWHAIRFAQTSAISEFYFRFQFRSYHRSRHILHQSAKFYPNRTALARKMTCRCSRWWISAILAFRGPIMGSLKSPCTTSYRSSIEIIALNCLVFEKIAFLHFGDRRTDEQMAVAAQGYP